MGLEGTTDGRRTLRSEADRRSYLCYGTESVASRGSFFTLLGFVVDHPAPRLGQEELHGRHVVLAEAVRRFVPVAFLISSLNGDTVEGPVIAADLDAVTEDTDRQEVVTEHFDRLRGRLGR